MNELLSILNKVKPGIDYVNEICDEFDVEILPTDVVPENFESVEAMQKLIMRLQED